MAREKITRKLTAEKAATEKMKKIFSRDHKEKQNKQKTIRDKEENTNEIARLRDENRVRIYDRV